MRKLAFGLAMVGMFAPSLGQAQVAIDMGRITCGEYLAMAPETADIFSAWMSGWFNQKMGYTYVNLQAYERNVANVTTWCATNPGELVMTGLQRATAK